MILPHLPVDKNEGLPAFNDLQYNSLGSLYKHIKKRMNRNE